MPANIHDVIKQMPAMHQKRVKQRAAELIAEEMTRQQLRRARKLTQTRLAKKLGVTQDSISRIEKRTDLLLSTLRGYVEAMGGSLSLIAEFPDRGAVILSGIAEVDPDPKPRRRKPVHH
jgi:DNA-binding XRE family transcriptional regulator